MRPRKPSRKRQTAFVPRIVFGTAIVGVAVIPFCACGGKVSGSSNGEPSVAAIGFDSGRFSVADSAFRTPDSGSPADTGADSGFPSTVAAIGFDSGFSVADSAFFVADSGFGFVADSGFGFVADSGFGSPDAGKVDSSFAGVAMVGFDGSTGEAGSGGNG